MEISERRMIGIEKMRLWYHRVTLLADIPIPNNTHTHIYTHIIYIYTHQRVTHGEPEVAKLKQQQRHAAEAVTYMVI